ncbi:MAG: hypothetical protein ACO4CT_12095 [Planctomycetota bacterium]
MATRRFGTLVRHLREDAATATELAQRLDDELLIHLTAALHEETRRRAMESGDLDAVIAHAFELGFGRDGLAVQPWVEAGFVVCPGGMVAKNRASHRCQFVSVDDTWIWESPHLLREDKRSTPGAEDGFRAVALLPLTEGLALDAVRARMRQGQHQVERVVSYEIRKGRLVEVAQREVSAARGGH